MLPTLPSFHNPLIWFSFAAFYFFSNIWFSFFIVIIFLWNIVITVILYNLLYNFSNWFVFGIDFSWFFSQDQLHIPNTSWVKQFLIVSCASWILSYGVSGLCYISQKCVGDLFWLVIPLVESKLQTLSLGWQLRYQFSYFIFNCICLSFPCM